MENILYFYLAISLCFTVFESINRVFCCRRFLGKVTASFWLATVRWLAKSFIMDLIINPLIMPQLTFNYVSKALKRRQ